MTDHHTCSMPQLTHRRFDYPSGSCVSAELPSVSSNTGILTIPTLQTKTLLTQTHQLNTGAMPQKISGVWGLAPNFFPRRNHVMKSTLRHGKGIQNYQILNLSLDPFKTVAHPACRPPSPPISGEKGQHRHRKSLTPRTLWVLAATKWRCPNRVTL
jgi:hypothetical protein